MVNQLHRLSNSLKKSSHCGRTQLHCVLCLHHLSQYPASLCIWVTLGKIPVALQGVSMFRRRGQQKLQPAPSGWLCQSWHVGHILCLPDLTEVSFKYFALFPAIVSVLLVQLAPWKPQDCSKAFDDYLWLTESTSLNIYIYIFFFI